MIKFFLTVLLIIFALRAVLRLLMPVVVSQAAKRMQQNMNEQFKQQQHSRQARPEGDIHVDYTPPKTKKKFSIRKEEGEFVDFEEIKK